MIRIQLAASFFHAFTLSFAFVLSSNFLTAHSLLFFNFDCKLVIGNGPFVFDRDGEM